MSILEIIASILGSIGTIITNPMLGLAGTAEKLAPLIGLVSSLAVEGAAAQSKLADLDTELKVIVTAARAPSDAEWADWDARHQAAKARLQA